MLACLERWAVGWSGRMREEVTDGDEDGMKSVSAKMTRRCTQESLLAPKLEPRKSPGVRISLAVQLGGRRTRNRRLALFAPLLRNSIHNAL